MKLFESIGEEHKEWIQQQPLFYVASAPLRGAHVNVSPKGHPNQTLALLSPTRVAYLDNTGSGIETVSHIYENGRVTVMFCGFGRAPRILRLFCRGQVVEREDAAFGEWYGRMRAAGMRGGDDAAGDTGGRRLTGVRAIVVLDVWQVQTSCGFGVPLIAGAVGAEKEVGQQVHEGTGIDLISELPKKGASADEEKGLGVGRGWHDRDTMSKWAQKMTDSKKIEAYRQLKNARSMDELPGLKKARRDNGEVLWVGDLMAWAKRVGGEWEAIVLGMLIALLLVNVHGIFR